MQERKVEINTFYITQQDLLANFFNNYQAHCLRNGLKASMNFVQVANNILLGERESIIAAFNSGHTVNLLGEEVKKRMQELDENQEEYVVVVTDIMLLETRADSSKAANLYQDNVWVTRVDIKW